MTRMLDYSHDLQPERHELDRPHLTSILDDNSVLVITAPAGYGKTTLLRQISTKLDYPHVWTALSEDSRDVNALTRAIAQTARRTFPALRLDAYDALQTINTTGDNLIRALAEGFNNFRPIRFIFDRAEHLGEEGFRWLRQLLSDLYPEHQMVIAQRAGPDERPEATLPEAKHVTHEQMAFTKAEIDALAKISRTSLDADDLHNATEGWPFGAMLAIHNGSLATSLEGLIEEILDSLPDPVSHALPSLAVLDEWPQNAPQLLELDLPANWTQYVIQSGFPVKETRQKTLMPHALTLEILEGILARDPVLHRRQHHLAAQIAQNSGLWLTAVKHMRYAGEISQAVNLISDLSLQWQQRSEWKLLRDVLEPISVTLLTPHLATLLGVSMAETGEPERGREILEAVRAGGEATQWTYFGLALLAFRRGETSQGQTFVEQGLTRPGNRYETIRLLEAKAALIYQSLYQRIDSNEPIENELATLLEVGQQSMERALNTSDPFSQVAALTTQALSLRTFGQIKRLEGPDYLNEVRDVAMRAVHIAHEARMPHRTLTALEMVRTVDYNLGQTSKSLQLVSEFLEVSKRAYPLGVPWMHNALAQHYISKGEFKIAREHLLKASSVTYGAITDRVALHLDLAATACYVGDIPEARRHQKIADELIREHALSGFDRGYVKGLIAFNTDDYETAQYFFQQVIEMGKNRYPAAYAIEHLSYAYLAECARREGRLTKDHIAELCDYAKRFPGDWIYRRDVDTFRDLFAYAIENDWFAPQLRTYLNRYDTQVPTETPFLYIVTLGNPQVHLDGRLLDFSPLQLETLVYLALNPKTTPETLATALWATEADAGKRSQRLQKTLSQIRATLGDAAGTDGRNIVLRNASGSYEIAGHVYVQTDYSIIWKTLRHANDQDACLQVFRNYRGDFLPGHYNDWVLSSRDQLLNLVADRAVSVGKELESIEPHKALDLYLLAARLDDLNVPALQAQLQLLTAMGESASAAIVTAQLSNIRRSHSGLI